MVSFVKIQNDAIVSYKQAINKSLDLIDYSFAQGTNNIVIKPNLCYYWDYTTGETTDPNFVAALIEVLRENISSKLNISVAESDASAMKCKPAFKMLGYEKMAQEYDVKLVNLSEDKTETVKACAGGYAFKLKVPEIIQNADLKINIPKIKYSVSNVKVTIALKNIFGCNPFPKKYKYHPKIWEVIVAINKEYNFDLCIIDGNYVSGIKPRKLSLVMASRDPVAIDAAASKIMGVNPKSVGYIQLAAKEGLGSIDFVNKGILLEKFEAIYPKKGIKSKLIRQAYELVVTMGLNKKIGLP